MNRTAVAWNRRVFSAFLLIFCAGMSAASSAVAHGSPLQAKGRFSSDVERDPRAFLVERLKILADSGRLYDPVFVAAVLNLRFRKETIERAQGDCSANPLQLKSDHLTRYIATGDVWYKTLAGGEPHVSIPGFTINPPEDSYVTPEIIYEITTTEDCSGGMALLKETGARLVFAGLPAFSCIRNVQDLLPKATFQLATDGYSQISYEGPQNDSSGTGLSFGYRAGFGCALDAAVGQSDRVGLRRARAEQKFQDCLSTAKKSFCASHDAFGWSDGKTQGAMLMDGIRQCGGLQQFYEMEPSTGEPPPEKPLDQNKHTTPCD
jgi:hypothetical protein